MRIPAGVTDGQRIRLQAPRRSRPQRRARPATSSSSATSGRITLFGRDGDNLTVRVPITFAEAALGADIDVPTLEGGRVGRCGCGPGTQSGQRHRVKGKGIETAKHTGDLIVTVDVAVPEAPERRAAHARSSDSPRLRSAENPRRAPARHGRAS